MLRLRNTRPIYKDVSPEFFIPELRRMLMFAEYESSFCNMRECFRHYCYSIFGYSGGWYDLTTHLAYPADTTDDKLGFRQRLLC